MGHLIDAEKAFWVIGGSKPGVMTKRAKWAFEKKEAADKFMLDNGGPRGCSMQRCRPPTRTSGTTRR